MMQATRQLMEGQGPRTLALRVCAFLFRELSERVIIVVIEKSERVDKRERETEIHRERNTLHTHHTLRLDG